MDDLFGQINCKSSADSIVMKILRTAMDRAHEKVQSKDGPIEFLHERSMFYELAAILVEGGLNIVQEEMDILEGSCDKILSDLREIRHWLQGRIQDMKRLIVEKDKELIQISAKESKLRQALELKERELVDMYEKLEPEQFKNGTAEGDISELKSSVDQQMWSIKQKLEDEEKCLTCETKKRTSNISSPDLSFDFLYNEMYKNPGSVEDTSSGLDRFSKIKLKSGLARSNQNILIQRMSSDIDILKETLDLAFGKMQSAEVLPLEKQWRWGIEKDVESVLLKGFISDIRIRFDVEMEKKVGFLKDNWFDSLNQIQTFHHDVREKPPNMLGNSECFTVLTRANSEPLPDIMSEDKLEVDTKFGRYNYVRKMVKNHKSIIREQNLQCNRLRRGVLEIKGSSASLSEKHEENNEFENGIQDVYKSNYNFDKRTKEDDDQEKRMIIPVPDVRIKHALSPAEKLEEERDGLCLQIKLMEDTYRLLFQGIVKDISSDLCFIDTKRLTKDDGGDLERSSFPETIERQLKEDVYVVFLKEMAEALKLEKDAYALESHIRDDIYKLLFVEAMKDLRESEAIKQNCLQEGTPHSRRPAGAHNFQEGTPRFNKFETQGGESLTRKLYSLVKCLEAEEDLMLKASSEIKKHSENHDLVISNCEEMDERNAIEWLLNDDESTLNSVSDKLGKALRQLHTSKELLVDLEQIVADDLGDGCYPVEQLNNSPNDKCEQNDPSDDVLAPIIRFQQVLVNVERTVLENLENKCFRLEELNLQVSELMKPVSRIRKRKLLYKKAFILRCHNLKLAESEVDLLGDQVEALLCLLERIYIELNQNAVVLSHYFEVFEILKLIKQELETYGAFSKQQDKNY